MNERMSELAALGQTFTWAFCGEKGKMGRRE